MARTGVIGSRFFAAPAVWTPLGGLIHPPAKLQAGKDPLKNN